MFLMRDRYKMTNLYKNQVPVAVLEMKVYVHKTYVKSLSYASRSRFQYLLEGMQDHQPKSKEGAIQRLKLSMEVPTGTRT